MKLTQRKRLQNRKPMARGKPLRARPPAPEPKPERALVLPTLRPIRAGVVAMVGDTPAPAAERFPYVRDKRLRLMCLGMPCQRCGANGADWAHSNHQRHGKGGAIKASDVYVAALCWPCHVDIDQGSRLTAEQRAAVWQAAWLSTVRLALVRATWPVGVAVPAEFYALTTHTPEEIPA